MDIPRLLIASLRSGAGKTSLAAGIMGSFAARGYRVQGFKVGPDFIDPGYHTAVTGRRSRNLDTWLLSPTGVREAFRRAARGADIAVVEGVMGLFDGLGGGGERGSSAEVAKLLGCPVVLVVEARGRARSAVADYLGCRAFDPDLLLAGVILNRVQSPRHRGLLEEGFSERGIPVLGSVAEGSLPPLQERHLGLVPVVEQARAGELLSELVRAVEPQLDLEALLQAAAAAPRCYRAKVKRGDRFRLARAPRPTGSLAPRLPPVRVAYAWDEAFHFYYWDAFELLEELGAELVPFSPLRGHGLPPGVSGVIIGGGFPEEWAPQLAENARVKEELREAARAGMPVYAECGGFMYLCEEIVDRAGRAYPMVGLIPGVCRMQRRLAGMGYVQAVALEDNLLCRRGETLRGHEFHDSSFAPRREDGFPWAFSFSGRGGERPDGYCRGNILASYLHFHFASRPRAAARFLEQCAAWRRGSP